MQRTVWVERTFNFDFPPGMIFTVIERLRGTVPHLKYMTAHLTDEQASQKNGEKWSIKEEIGHLSDLEDLHDGRLDDFEAAKEILRAADMANIKTNQALHNQKTLDELITYFENKRLAFISRLEALDDEFQSRKALHPRLQVMMRPVDMAYFTAEHDDHHLTTIRSLLKN